MEDLAVLAKIIVIFLIGCVGYSVIKFIGWILSFFGGVCLGC